MNKIQNKDLGHTDQWSTYKFTWIRIIQVGDWDYTGWRTKFRSKIWIIQISGQRIKIQIKDLDYTDQWSTNINSPGLLGSGLLSGQSRLPGPRPS